MYKKILLIIAIFAAALFPSSSFAHQKDDAPTITLDEFISRIQYNAAKQSWELKNEDKFAHVTVNIKYNFGVVLKGWEKEYPIRVEILLDAPHQNAHPRSFPTTNRKTVKVDDFKISFIPANDKISRSDFSNAVKQYEKFLQSYNEPMVFKTHATIWSTSRYLRKPGRFYYLNIYFHEITPETENK